jgi:hypothetical protein
MREYRRRCSSPRSSAVAYLAVNRSEEQRILKKLNFRVEWRARDLEAKIKLAGQSVVAAATDLATEERVDVEEFHQSPTDARKPNSTMADPAPSKIRTLAERRYARSSSTRGA